MPIPTDTCRSIKRLNWVFAASAILLLAVTAWSILQDFEKDWRKPQQNGKVWQAALVEEKIDRETTPEKLARLEELKKQIDDQSAKLTATGSQVAKLQQQIKDLESNRADVEFSLNSVKAQVTVAETALQDAQAGQLAEAQQNLTSALDRYDAALKIDPKHEASLFRSAIVFTQMKQYPKAIGRWEKYIKVTHGKADGYSNMALTLELSGDLAAAEASYKKGLSKEPSSEVCRVNYGLMLARTGRMEEAREQLRKTLKPEEVAYNLGSVYEGQGNKTQARERYQEALRIKPDTRAALIGSVAPSTCEAARRMKKPLASSRFICQSRSRKR